MSTCLIFCDSVLLYCLYCDSVLCSIMDERVKVATVFIAMPPWWRLPENFRVKLFGSLRNSNSIGKYLMPTPHCSLGPTDDDTIISNDLIHVNETHLEEFVLYSARQCASAMSVTLEERLNPTYDVNIAAPVEAIVLSRSRNRVGTTVAKRKRRPNLVLQGRRGSS